MKQMVPRKSIYCLHKPTDVKLTSRNGLRTNSANENFQRLQPKSEEPYRHLNPQMDRVFPQCVRPLSLGGRMPRPKPGLPLRAAASLVDQTLGLEVVPRTKAPKNGKSPILLVKMAHVVIECSLGGGGGAVRAGWGSLVAPSPRPSPERGPSSPLGGGAKRQARTWLLGPTHPPPLAIPK
ncbi:hypothetical protein JZ751_005837 [Albula glossodonta]|uniref:Uncharacterized protein n=1 Tax=Albula glossodonta TaxID=121402 RepID=A0A8T2P520_9TELE|nr:hypothetical protein JZ751_005837 [Albula glossodonta]